MILTMFCLNCMLIKSAKFIHHTIPMIISKYWPSPKFTFVYLLRITVFYVEKKNKNTCIFILILKYLMPHISNIQKKIWFWTTLTISKSYLYHQAFLIKIIITCMNFKTYSNISDAQILPIRHESINLSD